MPQHTVNKCYTSPTHEDNRKKLCLICLSSHKTLLRIQGTLQAKVENFVNFKINSSAPTVVICTTCKRKINANQIIILPDYSKFQFYSTRSSDVCKCFICETIRNRKFHKIKNGLKSGKKSVEKLLKTSNAKMI